MWDIVLCWTKLLRNLNKGSRKIIWLDIGRNFWQECKNKRIWDKNIFKKRDNFKKGEIKEETEIIEIKTEIMKTTAKMKDKEADNDPQNKIIGTVYKQTNEDFCGQSMTISSRRI